MPTGTEWTEQQIARLREFWLAGLPTVEIAVRLGMTKNAIVGKAHRLGLQGRPSPIKRTVRAPVPMRLGRVVPAVSRRPQSVGPAPITAPKPATAEPPRRRPPTPPLPIVRNGSPCCWPIGEPGTSAFRFCDEPAPGGRVPYCEAHQKIAFVRHRAA